MSSNFEFESSMDRKEIVISNVTCSEQFTNYKKADG